MKRANAFLLVLAVTVFVVGAASAAGPVQGTVPAEAPGAALAGHAYYDLTTGVAQWEANPAPLAADDVCSDSSSPALFAVSSTDLGSIWGDEMLTTDLGLLDQCDFTVFNANVSAGALASASFFLRFLDGDDFSGLGTFSTSVIDFGP